MPIKRRTRRRRRKQNVGLAVKPQMMTSYTKAARWQNVSSKIFFLRDNGTLVTDLAGAISQVWNVHDVKHVPQFVPLSKLYDQYKVLGMTVRLYPANVGTEPDSALFSVGTPGLVRGNAGIWSDQKPGNATQYPTTIQGMINYGSARLINPRRPYSRTVYRARGFPDYGTIEPTVIDDQWAGTINLLQLSGTASTATTAVTMWFWTRTFKLKMRGRRST